ncbi:MAG: formylglycine-generating enzyme family protein, partial [bacterium]|nr:formylglycine-generating enzyme family protein [bacterium]
MKKYFFILIAALIACTVAIAQTSGSKRPKKKKQITEKVVKKNNSKRNQSGKKPNPPKKQYSEEPRVSSSYTDDGIMFSIGNVRFEMVRVEGGTFSMGATAEQGSDADSEEKPAHQVTLSSYMIGKTEVTQELWEAVMGSNPSYFKGSNLPVELVTWEACQTFIRKLNALTGKNFRLPTEAEWEFAARGGNNSRGYKYSGSNTLSNVAWYDDNSSSTTHPVATK